MILKNCPYCNKIFENGCLNHSYKCSNKTKEETIKDVYLFNIPKEVLENFEKESEYMSLPDFKKKYNLNFKQTLLLYKIFNIKPRTLKEAVSSKETREKYKQTCLKKYGDINTLGKKSPIYLKRNQTIKEKYGVSNVFQLEEIKEKSKQTCLKKYGEENYNKTIESKEKHKQTCLKKYGVVSSLCLEKSRIKNNGNIKNRLTLPHKIVSDFLFENNIEHFNEKSDEVKYKDENNKWHYVVPDIIIKNKKKIIEVYGDYWHCNPSFYKKEQQINFNGHLCRVNEIWEKDRKRNEGIKNSGYEILILWQYDIKNNFNFVIKKIINFIGENYENNKN